MTTTPKPALLALAKLPPDVTAALSADNDIVSADDIGTERASRCDIAVTTAMRGFSADDMRRFPALRLVLSQGVGRDRLDPEGAAQAGVRISITPDILTEDVADFAIGLMYAVARRIVEADRFVRTGRWPTARFAASTSLDRKRMGIVGMGKIGRSIARRAVALGMSVAYSARAPKPDLETPFFPDPAMLAKVSDVLVLACAGGEQTRHLCDARVLEALGSHGFVVNIARGSVIDEQALLEALEQKRIAGAALDVFATEPDINRRFKNLENVVLTPHSASITSTVRTRLIACMLEEISAYRAGSPPLYAIN